MNLNMKSLFGQANKGLGKLKGFIFGSSSSEETSQSPQSETNQKINPNQPQKIESDAKSPKKDDSKSSNTIIKSSKGQFDFSEEDDDEDTKPKKNQSESESQNKNFEYSEPEEDYWKIAHRLYLKNSMVDIEPLPYVPFIKVKKNDNILSLIGFGKKNQIKEIKYFAVFDEHFLYMINMTTKDNNQNNFFKKIGNHYDLTKISNIEITDDIILEGKKLIKLVFLIDNDSNNFTTVEKELHFEKNDAKKFFEILKFYLKKYDVPLITKDSTENTKEGSEEKEDEDEEEEEEDDEEEDDKKENENEKDNKDKDQEKPKDKDDNDKEEENKKEKREVKEEKEPNAEEKKENIEEKQKDPKKEELLNNQEKKEELNKEVYKESEEPFMQIISKELIELLNIPANKKCFDCESSPANWVCVNNAIFLCSKCAGEHRGYGAIISNLKFMMLDKLNEFQIATMKRGGNKVLDRLLKQYSIDKKTIDKLILYSSRLLEYHRNWLYNKLAGKSDPKPPNKYEYSKIMNNFKDNPRPPLEKVKIKDSKEVIKT